MGRKKALETFLTEDPNCIITRVKATINLRSVVSVDVLKPIVQALRVCRLNNKNYVVLVPAYKNREKENFL